MSKIFETLNKGGGRTIADLIRPLVGLPEDAGLRGGAGPEPVGTPVDGAAPLAKEGAVSGENFPARIRTLGLRIPAPSPLLPFEDGQWRASEQYRVLRTKIVQHPKQPRVLVISSPAPGDGKSITAINLAAILSLRTEAQVLLVDADLRNSAIHVRMGLPEAPGLADVLRGGCNPEDALINTRELPNLCVMSAGAPPGNPVELLDSAKWPAVCTGFRSLFRYVVIDSPPIAAVADFDLIQALCDGVVLVVRPDHTHRQLLARSLEIVAKQKLLGVVLNCVPEWFLAKGSSPDYYYYRGGYDPAKADLPKAR